MKHAYFIQLISLAGILFCNYLCKIIFDINALTLTYWWIRESPDRGIAVFSVGLCGLLFFGMTAFRCQNIYTAATGTPEYYIFLGDRLDKGFYGYKSDDTTQTRVFIPSSLDATVHPAASFYSLYSQKGIFHDKTGEFLKMDFLWLPNLIIWSIASLTMFLFWICGILMVFKNYAIKFPPVDSSIEAIKQTGIGGIYSYVSGKTNALQFLIYGMLCFGFISIIWIRFILSSLPVPANKSTTLAMQLKPGIELTGKIIDEMPYSFSNTTSRRPTTIFYERYAMEFEEGFLPPVVINFRLLKTDPAVPSLSRALKENSLVKIILDEDLAIDTTRFYYF